MTQLMTERHKFGFTTSEGIAKILGMIAPYLVAHKSKVE